jgi:hypothetical protein
MMARKKNNTNQKNEPLKPPDITDPLFPYGPKNKHLQGVLGIRKDAKHRKDIIQTPVTLEEDKYLQEINETIEEIQKLIKKSENTTTITWETGGK